MYIHPLVVQFFDRITSSLNETDEHPVDFIKEALSIIPVANRYSSP
jgi:hypothetical protein